MRYKDTITDILRRVGLSLNTNRSEDRDLNMKWLDESDTWGMKITGHAVWRRRGSRCNTIIWRPKSPETKRMQLEMVLTQCLWT